MNDGMREYTRPAPSEDELVRLMRLASRVILSPKDTQIKFMSLLLLENLSLTKEVNDHRMVLGYAPLPTYDPKA